MSEVTGGQIAQRFSLDFTEFFAVPIQKICRTVDFIIGFVFCSLGESYDGAARIPFYCAGLPLGGFAFVGFLPRRAKHRTQLLARVRAYPETLVFYEAPHRLRETLALLAAELGAERRACAARELTKKFEEFRRETLGELAAYYGEHEPRGEFVIVVAGADETPPEDRDADAPNLHALYAAHLAAGADKKEAMRRTARDLGISRREVYKALLEQEEGTTAGDVMCSGHQS